MDHNKQHEVVFTKRRAILGLLAYIAIGLLVAGFF